MLLTGELDLYFLEGLQGIHIYIADLQCIKLEKKKKQENSTHWIEETIEASCIYVSVFLINKKTTVAYTSLIILIYEEHLPT